MDVQAALDNKLNLLRQTTAPNKWSNLTPCYQYGEKFVGNNVQIMELGISFKLFVKNAQGWGQFDYEHYTNLTHYVDKYMKLVGEIARRTSNDNLWTAITCELIPKRRIDPKDVPFNLGEDLRLYEALMAKRMQQDFVGMRLRLAVNFDTKKITQVEQPEQQDTDEKRNNKQTRQVQPKTCLGDYVHEIVETNQRRIEQHLQNPRNVKENLPCRTPLDEVNMIEYRKLVAALKGYNYKIDESNTGCIHPKSCYNPENAFAPIRDAEFMMAQGAAPECCNGDNYMKWQTVYFDNSPPGKQKVLTFPFDSKHVYLIHVGSFLPEDQKYMYFPHIKPPVFVDNIEKEFYRQWKACDKETLAQYSRAQRNQLKIGFPTDRSKQKALDVMKEIRAEIPQVKLEPREGYNSDEEEDVVEGVELQPSKEDSLNAYDQIVMQHPFGSMPDYDLDQFKKEGKELYKKNVECHPMEIDNPEYTKAVRNLLRQYQLRPGFDIDGCEDSDLKDRLLEDREKIQIPKKILNPEWKKARHEHLMERYIDFLQYIWHEDACVPDSIKAICIWERQFLAKNKKFSLPLRKKRANLSPFADNMVYRMDQLDACEDTHTTHCNIILHLLAAFQVFFPSMMHAHIFLAGPPKAGKSRTQQKAIANMIPGTHETLTYESLKSKTGSDIRASTHKVEFYEDIQPSVIGVGQLGEQSDQAAILKNILSKGEYSYSVLVIGADGKRKQEKRTVKVNNLFCAAMNINFSMIPASIISRVIAITVQNDEREDKGGQVNKVTNDDNPIKNRATELSRQRWQRDQCLTAKIAYFVTGLDYMLNVNTECSKAVIALVAESATQEPYCLRGFGDVRKMEQLNFLCQPLVCLDAIHYVFDSDVSDIKNMDYHPTHFLRLLPHLFSKAEHAIFALGLIEHQFEDAIAQNVASSLVKYVFDEPVRAQEQKKEEEEQKLLEIEEHKEEAQYFRFGRFDEYPYASKRLERKTQEEKKQAPAPAPKTWSSLISIDGYYTCINLNSVGLSSYKKSPDGISKTEKPEEILKRLANNLQSRMNPKPQPGDVFHALNELLNKYVSKEVEESKTHGHMGENTQNVFREFPVLEIDTMNNKLKILTSFLQDQRCGRKRLLKDCITKKLSHASATPATYLYGSPIDRAPNVLDVIHIAPNPHHHIKMVNAEYCNEAIRDSVISSVADQSMDTVEVDWNKMFPEAQKEVMDDDLDDYFTDKFNWKMRFSDNDVGEYGFLDPPLPLNHPRVQKTKIERMYDLTELQNYPDSHRNNKRKSEVSSRVRRAQFKMYRSTGVSCVTTTTTRVNEEDQMRD